MAGITKRQKEVFDFVSQFINDNGYSPTYKEIGEGCKMKSRAQVSNVVMQLKDRGLIRMVPGHRRTIEIASNDNDPERELLERQVVAARNWLNWKERWDMFRRENPNHADNSEYWSPAVFQAYNHMVNLLKQTDPAD